MVDRAATGTATRVAGYDIVVVQDTSEMALGGRRARANGYGPVGKGGALGGLLLHAGLALEVGSGALLGLVDARVWNRDQGAVSPRRSRATADKESRRWLDTTARAAQVLAAARSITVVSDRESDIYEHFAYRPANTHLIVRACQNRKIRIASGEADALLFGFIDGLPEVGRFCTKIPAAPGRKAREAELAVRLAPVVLCKPQNGAGRGLPDTIDLVAVDVREVSVPADGEPVRWRLLTTHPVTSLGDARRIVDLYRMRWTIEEFFRTLKSAGFDIEEADISEPRVMTNFMTAAAVAAVTIMQLVKARDGTTDRLLADAFEPADQPVLEAVIFTDRLDPASLSIEVTEQDSVDWTAWYRRDSSRPSRRQQLTSAGAYATAIRDNPRAFNKPYSCVVPSGISAPLRLTPSRLASVRIARDSRDSERSAPVRLAPVRSAPNRSAPESLAPLRFASRITASISPESSRFAPSRLVARSDTPIRLARAS